MHNMGAISYLPKLAQMQACMQTHILIQTYLFMKSSHVMSFNLIHRRLKEDIKDIPRYA